MPPTSQNSFAWTDPRTGQRYWGDEAGRMMVAYMTGGLGPQKGVEPGPNAAPPPPPGTYDPAIDYNAGGSQRGYDNTRDDAATLFTRGQEDYGLGLGDLTRQRDDTLHDLDRSQIRLDQDNDQRSLDLQRQFGILGRQQAEGAAQRGITSQGLLGKSAQVRGANQAREQSLLTTAWNRGREDINVGRARTGAAFDRGKTGLDLGNAREFGGYGGNMLTNPLTGKPQVGSLLTGLTRAGTENNAFQTLSGTQRSQQATQAGYIAPGVLPSQPHGAGAAAEFMRRLRGGR